MEKPLISIAMATYNGEKYLEEQLDSIIAQTYRPIEIVVSDDCSTDTTVAILKDYTREYSFIRMIENTENVGYIKNFEKAASYTTGDFIMFADQDDIWFSNKVDTLFKHINGSFLAYSNSYYLFEENKTLDIVINGNSYYSFKKIAFKNSISGFSLLISRKLLEIAIPFSKHLPHDYWMALIAADKESICFVNKPLAYYRQHKDNLIGSNRNNSIKTNNSDKRYFKKQKSNIYFKKTLRYYHLYNDSIGKLSNKNLRYLYSIYSFYSSFFLKKIRLRAFFLFYFNFFNYYPEHNFIKKIKKMFGSLISATKNDKVLYQKYWSDQ